MPPTVSIVMPAYNAEKYIVESIQSVRQQTYPHWELVIVDDGSQDETVQRVQSIIDIDPRVRCISQTNQGQSKARNAAIKASVGSLIAFLDADDLWMKDKLELQVHAMERENVDVAFHDSFVFFNDNINDESVSISTVAGRFAGPAMFDVLFLCNTMPVPSVMARREIIQKVGAFDETFPPPNHCEDYDLWLRLAASGATFFGLPEKLMRIRRHDQSVTATDTQDDHSPISSPPATLASMINVLERHKKGTSLDDNTIKNRLAPLYESLIVALLQQNKRSEAQKWMRRLQSVDPARLLSIDLTITQWALKTNRRALMFRHFIQASMRSPRRVVQERALVASVLLGGRFGSRLYRAYLKRFRPQWFNQHFSSTDKTL